MDINGNVNAFANWTKAKGPESSGNNVISGGEVPARQAHEDNIIGINTGLLPAWLGFTGTTRQNDLDVELIPPAAASLNLSSATASPGFLSG